MKMIFLPAIVILTGCALPTTSVPRTEAIQATEAQILAPELLNPSPERTERVLLIRDTGLMGSAVEAVVKINRKPLVSLNTKQMIIFYLAPGKYMFSVEAKKQLIRERPGESDLEIIKGGLNNFRLRLIPGDGPRIERSEQLE